MATSGCLDGEPAGHDTQQEDYEVISLAHW